jgi:hypothetical protein
VPRPDRPVGLLPPRVFRRAPCGPRPRKRKVGGSFLKDRTRTKTRHHARGPCMERMHHRAAAGAESPPLASGSGWARGPKREATEVPWHWGETRGHADCGTRNATTGGEEEQQVERDARARNHARGPCVERMHHRAAARAESPPLASGSEWARGPKREATEVPWHWGETRAMETAGHATQRQGVKTNRNEREMPCQGSPVWGRR